MCPWDEFTPAVMHFCERELCGWITQPANTWSNLAYLVVGAWLIHLALREGRRSLVSVGVMEIVIGIGSFIFHMSSTWFGEVLDLGGMYLLSSFLLFMNLERSRRMDGRPLSSATLGTGFALTVALSIAVVSLWGGEVGIWLFVAQVVGGVSLERRISRNHVDRSVYRPIKHLLVTFGVAWAAWWLDVLKIVCDPDNHWVQGHAIWHLLNAFVFVFVYRFYAGVSEVERSAAWPPARRPEKTASAMDNPLT